MLRFGHFIGSLPPAGSPHGLLFRLKALVPFDSSLSTLFPFDSVAYRTCRLSNVSPVGPVAFGALWSALIVLWSAFQPKLRSPEVLLLEVTL